MKSYLFLLLLLLPLVSAIPLTSPASQEITLFTHTALNAFINVTNPSAETMYFVQFQSDNPDIQFIDTNFNLTSNTTKEVKLLIDSSETYDKTSIIKILFFKQVSVNLNPENKAVSITAAGYQPQTIDLVKSSSITFTNNDVIAHSVTGAGFDLEIAPGQTASQSFTTPGVIAYHDKFTNFQGTVNVLDTTGEGFARDPSQDGQFTLRVKSKKVETSLEATMIDGAEYTVESNGKRDSVLKLKNIGNMTAANVTLKAEWLEFGKKNFLLQPGEETFVTFSIFPQIIKPEETNLTYQRNITIEGTNTLAIAPSINIFVPFNANANINDTVNSFFGQTVSLDFAIALLNTVCKAQPDYQLCKPQLVEKIVYQDNPISLQFTPTELQKLKNDISAAFSEQARQGEEFHTNINEIKGAQEQIRNQSIAIGDVANNALLLEQENKEGRKIAYTIAIVLAVLAVLSVLAYFFYRVYQDKMGDTDGIRT